MATAPPVLAPTTPEETRRRVQHPLDRLRGYIRSYVSLEGAAIVAIYLALWFWIGLVLDYGFFKAFDIDWVQELPREVRAGILIALLTGLLALVTLKVVLRVARDFRDAPLALVLERRFPSLLGDRLITAVELADPRLAQRYGYSQPMVELTIQQAAERVAQVPVRDAFNWDRLKHYGWVVLAVTLGIYFVVGAGYCLAEGPAIGTFVSRFNDVAVIWLERNILLSNTIWPRQAYLELVGFPESGDLKVGRNSPSAPVRVRALKWVIADETAAEGWRALTWADLSEELLGFPVPPLPRDWLQRQPFWTVDQVDLRYANDEARQSLDADSHQRLGAVLDRLHELAADPRMSRRLRELKIPGEVVVYYRGSTIRDDMTLSRGGDNEFSGTLSDLKESVRFTVRGLDYYTPWKTITVVPPPSVVSLSRDEDRPAYLYHRPPLGGTLEDLKGLKQRFRDLPVSLSGETSRIEVPWGTDLLLTGVTDKELKHVELRPRERRPGTPAAEVSAQVPLPAVQLAPDGHTFRARFANLSGILDFDIEFTDTDGVMSRRHVIIRATEDASPEVNVQVEVIRKTPQGFMVTPIALIPFSGGVRDDHGLDKVDYGYVWFPLESASVVSSKLALVAGAFHFVGPSLSGGPLLAPGYLRLLSKIADPGAEDRPPDFAPVGTFTRLVRERAQTDVTFDTLRRRLEQPVVASNLIRDVRLDPDSEGFDLQRVLPELRVSDDKTIQPRYRLRLWVTATDNNIETGPRSSPAKERFNFIVVSETELLAEVAKEEENLHVKLEEAVNRLKEGKIKLEQIAQELRAGVAEAQLRPLALRAQDVEDTIVKSMDLTREVFTDYSRILKELKANRVQAGMVTRVEDNICKPLDSALGLEFIRAEEAQRDFRRTLEARKPDEQVTQLADQRLEQLIDRLVAVLDQMGDLTTINKLIVTLRNLEEGQRNQSDLYKEIKKRLEDDLLKDLIDPKDKK
ncbi:MAG: hypothetical protein NZ700_04880 [Gemmataceae bacterium]|nr:hypothetical protein [Gemmataceae bacterium]MDW8267472.1 hypothetical protein [Gemmataceae bacterium]